MFAILWTLASATLTTSQVDINNNSPVFDKTQYSFNVLESQTAPVNVGNVSATDQDSGLNGEIWYLYQGPDSFAINRTSGLIQTTRPLDRELIRNYTLTVYAYDNGRPRHEGSCTVTIIVNDVNDNAPKFKQPYYTVTISEAYNCFQSAMTNVSADDPDDGLNGQVLYTITNGSLSINSGTGVIMCKIPGLDYENPSERDIIVQVTATDRGNPPLTASVTVRVRLTDVNDNSPEFIEQPPYNITLPKEAFQISNTTVYAVSARDRDSNENGLVFYTLTSRDPRVADLIWVDTSGVVRVNKTQSFPQDNSYTFDLVASDRGQPSKNKTTFLTLNVVSLGQSIQFSKSDFIIIIEEGKAPNITTPVGILNISNSNLASQATFTLSNNTVLNVNASSGQLYCISKLDREQQATYEILATVKDRTDSISQSYAMVFVIVSDVNDNAPEFDLSDSQMVTDIEENSATGKFIIAITANDADAGNNSILTYFLLDPNIPFAVGVSDGRLVVNGTLDRETITSYTFVLMVKDNGSPSLSSSATVTVYIDDENDNAPTFNTTETLPVPEDADYLTWSAVVKATDPDYGMNGLVKYTVKNMEACPFSVNDDGVLKLERNKTLDFETNRSHTCIIQASDSPETGALSTTITAIIKVTDVNDNSPVFHDVIGRLNVSCDVGIPYVIVVNLNATDADSGINAEIWFDIDASTFAFDLTSYFDINAVSGMITVQKPLLDFPLESFNLTIVAHDKGEPALSSKAQIEVIIVYENTPPKFGQDVYSINITEEDYTVLLQPLITVRAYDNENQILVDSCNCTYVILGAIADTGRDVSDYFSMDNSMGTISLTRENIIDREITGNQIVVNLKVTDKGMPPKSDLAILLVRVLDINDNAPMFDPDFDYATISKSKCQDGQVIYKAIAHDSDIYPNNITTYSLNPHQSLSFTGIDISETTGELSLINPNCSIDTIDCTQFLVLISASDGNYSSSLRIAINVNLSDSDQNEPVFCQLPTDIFKNEYYANINSDVSNNTVVLNASLDIGGILRNPDNVKIMLHPSDSFLYIPDKSNHNFSILTHGNVPAWDKIYTFFIEAEITYGDTIVKDFTSFRVNVTRAFPIPAPVRGAFVVDGTREGSIIYDLSNDLGNIDGVDLSLNSTGSLFRLSKQDIVCDQNINFETWGASPAIGHLVTLNIFQGQTLVLVLKVAIIVNKHFIQVNENSELGLWVAEFDSISESYNISLVNCSDPNFFQMSVNQTHVQLSQSPDYETITQRRFTFELSIAFRNNSLLRTIVTAEITVVDVNDVAPAFVENRYFFTTQSGAPTGTVLGLLEVTDPDTVLSNYSYQIEITLYQSYFQIQPNSGAIVAIQDLKDLNSTFSFNVSVHDGHSKSLTPTLVTVVLSEIKTNLEMVGSNLTASVLENKPSGTIVINASLANYAGYQLLPADVIRFFIIDSQTGLVTTTSEIDREADVTPKTFSAIAYSKDKPCDFKIIGIISVEIVDENDNSPVFTEQGKYRTQIIENSPSGTKVFTVRADDIDKGENSTIMYNISGINSPFEIDRQSGEITVASSGQALLDRETADTLLVTVMAIDGGLRLMPSLRKTATATLTITLMDVNDNSPQFGSSQYTFTLFENQPADFLVGNVSATDRDINENGAIWYSLFSGGRGYFWLTTTGELRTKLSIDREKDMNSQFNLTIIAYDNGSPSRNDSTLVIVNVEDVNDISPVFQESKGYRVDISEGSDCTTSSIIQVIALDGDEGLSGQVFYTLDKSGEFVINSSTGNITCKSPGLDYENETQRDIIIHVIASDKGTPSLNSTTTVRITLLDLNDNSPVFVGLPYNVSVASTLFKDVNNTVYVINVLDSDSGQNGNVDLKISNKSSDGGDLLWLDNKGIIRVKTDHIFMNASNYVLPFTIEATDRGIPVKTSQTDLSLTVNGSGTTHVRFSISDFTFVVEEGSCTHSKLIGKLEATVTPGLSATYKLATLDFPFSINSTTAEINCLGPLDRETKDTYQMLANATAAASNSYAIVTVTVSDVNDNAPKFSVSEEMITDVPESASLGEFVITVIATDLDALENGTIAFSILETNTRFRINETDGRLYVSQGLDRETEPNYKVTVMARDKGTPSLSTTTRVSITVLDVNDNAPVFNTSFSQIFRVPENASVSSEVGRVQATDKDYAENGTVTYSIVSNTTECPFMISDGGTNGMLRVITGLDYERERLYNCTVQAKDSATIESARLSSNLTVTIQVTDVNDNSPIINDIPSFISFNISRDIETPYDIISKLNASDADEGVNAAIAFTLSVADIVDSYFRVDNDTGRLSIQNSLQNFPQDSVNLTIIAQDRGTPPLSTSLMIEVLISDSNTAPQFEQSLYSYSVTEEDPSSIGELFTIKATDYEDKVTVNCNCTYTIVSAYSARGQNVIDYFSFLSSSGVISLLKVTDREQLGDAIAVKLKATDSGIPAKSTTTLLNITIVDINDNRPQFGQLLYEATIPKAKCKAGSHFFNVNASDVDLAPNNVIRYRLLEQSNFVGLTINEMDGALVLTDPVCAAKYHNKQFTVIVIASDDHFKQNVTTTVVITVNQSDSNVHAPNFQSGKYHANVPFTAPVGTSLPLLDFFASDNDGDNITYTINGGNLKCPETIFIIDNITGVIKVNYDLERISVDYFSLIVTATDSGDFDVEFTKTGTTTVEVSITDIVKVCYNPAEVAELSSDANQFKIFRGLFIALAVLLSIAITTSVYFLYKWRVANSRSIRDPLENDESSFQNIFRPSGKIKVTESFSSGSVKKADTSGMPPCLPRRDVSQDIIGESVSGQSMDSAGYLMPSEPTHSSGQRQSLSGDYKRFNSGMPEDIDNERPGYLSLMEDPPPPAPHQDATYLTATPDTYS